MEQPLVSVLLLTYNSADIVERCLTALHRQTYRRVELVCVDNASTDETVERLRALDLEVTVNADNTGFARGMNQALLASSGEVVVFLNSDCLLDERFLETAVELLQQNAEIDALGATVARLDGVDAEALRPGVYKVDGALHGISRAMRVTHREQTSAEQPTFLANGACPVVRRSLLDRMAGTYGVPAFEPLYDTYAEDIDFAFRAAAIGATTLCSTELVAWHIRSLSGGAIRVWDKRGRMRTNIVAGRYLNCWRHLPLRRALATHALLLAQDLGLILLAASKGDLTAAADVRRAWLRIVANRSVLRDFRREHQTWRKIPVGATALGLPLTQTSIALS